MLSFSRRLGDEWSVKPEVIDDIERFTCLMYGQARVKSVNAVRSIMLKQMVGEDEELTPKTKVDLSRLPPYRDSLVPHIYRVNHRLAHYKRADKATFFSPKPYDPLARLEEDWGGHPWASVVMWPYSSPFPHWLGREDCWGSGGGGRRRGRNWLWRGS